MRGNADLIIVKVNVFDVVLGKEFLVEKSVILIPSLGNLLIIEKKPTMVPAKLKLPQKMKLLSTLQFKRGVKREDPTYVAILALNEEGWSPFLS